MEWVPEGELPACPPPGDRSARAPSRALHLPCGRGVDERGQTFQTSACRGPVLSKRGQP
jgi:hypothetical protein